MCFPSSIEEASRTGEAVVRSSRRRISLRHVLTFGEIRFGIELLPPSKRRNQLERWLQRDLHEWFEGRILPVDQSIAGRWGLLRAQAQLKGRPLSVIDALLAATAVQHNLTIVSRNASDFSLFDLAVVNPWES